MNQFRTQKETMKAQCSAAQAIDPVNEGVAGDFQVDGQLGRRPDRAQDENCRYAGALRWRWTTCWNRGCSRMWGASGTDDIPKGAGPDRRRGASVDQELAALKAEVATPPTLGAGEGHEGESPGA